MTKKSRLYCFTKYTEAGPSSRYRTYQYLDVLKKEFEVKVYPGFGDWYLSSSSNKLYKSLRLITAFMDRWLKILTLPSDCIVWIEYELFPYMPAWAESYLVFRKINYGVDYDDAIFHNYDTSPNWLIRTFLGKKISYVMRHASEVVTGSPYLTRYALQYNVKTIEIPTSVDLTLYNTEDRILQAKETISFIVGWLGSKSTSVNLRLIKEPLTKFLRQTKSALWLMGFDESLKEEWEHLPVTFFKWAKEDEIPFLNSIDIGIMPLYDTPFNHGKCGFKLIQYMAAGKPTISTPMEANVKINRHEKNKHATSQDEWMNSLIYFASHKREVKEIGADNEKIIKQYYSKKVNTDSLIAVLKKMEFRNE